MRQNIAIRLVGMVTLRLSSVMRDASCLMSRMRCGIRRIQYNGRCNQKGRDHLKAASGGFTLIEIVIVVVILAIAAMTAIPILTSATSFQIRSAANIIAADLEYAKTIAISKGQSFSVVFDKTTESYRIEDESSAVIAHPVKKGFNYIIDFQNDGRLDKVDIENVDFDPGSGSTITFDYLGSPYSGSGISNPLNSGIITLKAGNMAATINIEPVTGFISIVD
jgi:prepilin-type N-terminal cleavage/methylation domain-containing protein